MKTRTTALLLLAGLATSAHAAPEGDITVSDADQATKADKPAPRRRHLRMALELTTIMVVGNRWYWRDNGKPRPDSADG